MRHSHAMTMVAMLSACAPLSSDRFEIDPDALRMERHVGPPISYRSGSRMSAADVARMSQRRSRQRAAGKRRS